MALPRFGPQTTDPVAPERRFRRIGSLADSLLRAAVRPRKHLAAPQAAPAIAARLAGSQPFLAEWLTFHRSNGIEHFYIFDAGLAGDRLSLLSARSDCTVVTWLDPRRDIFLRAQQLTAASTDWLIVLQDTHFLYGLDQPLSALLPAYAGYPALAVHAVLFGSYTLEPPAGVPLTEHSIERAEAVSGAAERELQRLRGTALIWNQRFELRRPFATLARGYLRRAALLLGGVQLNQYLIAPAQREDGLQVTTGRPLPTELLMSRGPFDDSASVYSPAVRKALGLRGTARQTAVVSAPAAALPAAENRPAPRELVVVGMQHGGVQPVVRWLLSGLAGRWVYLHNQAPGRPVFRNERAAAATEGVSAEQLQQLAQPAARRAFDGVLIHSYLDVAAAETAAALQSGPLLGPSARRLVLTVVRDPINLYAARLQRARRRGWRGQLPAQSDGGDRLRRCWISHAAELLRAERTLPQCLPLHVGRFLTDADYRRDLAALIGIAAEPAQAWQGQLLQLPQNEEDSVERLLGGDWQTRWHGLEADREYLAFFDDAELLQLQAEYIAQCPPLAVAVEPLLAALPSSFPTAPSEA
jgi:hypothetical protein